MFKNKSIKFRMLAFIFSSTLLIFIVTLTFIAIKAKNLTEKESIDKAMEISYHYSNVVKAEIDIAMDNARAIAEAFEGMKANHNIPRREEMNMIIKRILEKNENFIGTWTLWEPNALDGKDAEYANTEGHDATGRFIPYWNRGAGSIKYEKSINYDKPGDGDYYLVPIRTKKEIIMDPYQYVVSGKNMYLTTVSVPIFVKGEVAGVMGIDFKLTDFVDLVSKIKPFETGNVALIANNGTFVATSDPKQIGKDIGSGGHWEKVKRAIKEGNVYKFMEDSKEFKGEVTRIFVPIKIGKTTTPWSFMVNVPMDKVRESADSIISEARIIGFIALLLLLALIYFIANSITKPLNQVVDNLKDIAEGEGDLTVRLEVKSQDELGELSKWFNIFIDKIHKIINNLASQSSTLTNTSEEIKVSSDDIVHILENIVAKEFEQAYKLIQESTNKVNSNVKATNQTNENISSISDNANIIQDYFGKLENNSKQLEGKILSVTTAVDEMNATIGEITKNTTRAANISKTADKKSQEAKQTMQDLNKMANDINAIVDLIKDISSQTNLLALNATIEAASAGSAGKGFAVVANEIKNLASQTAEATKKINDQILAVQHRTEESVGYMEEIGQVVTSLNEINLTIASTLEQQSATINDISQDMNMTAETTSDTVENVKLVGEKLMHVTHSIDSTNTNIERIANDTHDVSDIMKQVNDRMGVINKAAGDNYNQAKAVEASASDLSKVSDDLNDIIDMFKL